MKFHYRVTSWIKKYPLEAGMIVLFALTLFAVGFIPATPNYPEGSVITIRSGSTISETASLLREDHVIRSGFVFSVFVRVFNSRGGVLEGTYSLPRKENVLSLAYRFAKGITGTKPVKVTIPEGSTTREVGEILLAALGDFDIVRFQSLAKSEEGYLFPDTYFFLPGTPPETVIQDMRSTFDKRIKPLEEQIRTFGVPLDEVVIMASILEKEARQTETRRTVAGILWKRIDNNFPLQVDAVFGYIFNRATYSPTFEDLEVDSPYNTYKNLGLPPGPIANPGLDAIEAAITPIQTPYFFYLTGKDGNMYYAKTFDEHVANRVRLR